MKRIITLVSAIIFSSMGFAQTYINEDFSSFNMPVIPPITSGWKSIDSLNFLNPSDSIWRFDNPGNHPVASPMSGNVAIVDSDFYGNGHTQDCYLSTPSFDASLATLVLLEFDHYFQAIGASFGEIQVFDGISWVTDTIFNATTNNTEHEVIDISALAAGNAAAQVRFRYTGSYSWQWVLDNIVIFQPTPDDVSVVSVDSTVAGCNLTTTEQICATIVNAGSTPVTNIPVNYSINGGPIVTETASVTLNPGDSIIYCFTTGADLSMVGTYNIDVFTSLRNDANNVNDTSSGISVNKAIITSYPYNQGFEMGNGGWISDGTNNTWDMGTPTGSVINSAANGVNAYVTNLTGNYNNNEESYVLGPCFDFTTLNAPQFKMNVWWNSENSWDGAVLQMSIDNGVTWTQVGTFLDPNNWYNDNTINGLQNTGFSGEGWTGNAANIGSNGWVLAEHDLTGAANQPSVQLRIAFGSDGSVQDEGFAFDDIVIQEAPAVDAGLATIISPVTGCGLGAADSVCISIVNYGGAAISNFPVAYVFNGNLLIDTVPFTINPGDTARFCFDSTVNVSVIGNYSIVAYTDIPTDGNPLNDTASNTFDNIPIVSGYPYSQDFESGNGGWVSGGINSSWAVGAPAGLVINSAANGISSYITGLAVNYNTNEASFVQGPCFDFSTLNQPQIKLNVWWNSENSWDGAVLQSSIDGGATWQKVGDFLDPNNWYNDNTINGLQNAGQSGEGWAGRAGIGSGGWVLAEHDLVGLGNQAAVILRIAFGSDGSVQDDGFAFEDILILDAPPIDANLFDIVQPNSGCGLTASESIEVRIINSGSASITGVPVVVIVNGGTPILDTFPGTILPGDTVFHLFSSTIDLSVVGDFSFNAYSNIVGDGNILNDSASKTVTSVSTVTTFPYSEGFENGTGGWLADGVNSSWEQGVPANVIINLAGSGISSYVTNLTGNYNVGEISYLVSPCMDFTNLTTDPLIRFGMAYAFGFNGDAWLEQSISGGAWTTIIDNGGALEWYNNTGLQRWDGASSGGSGAWVVAENTLLGIAGQSDVRFRFVMDGDNFSVGEGIGVDDIYIDLPPSDDAGVIALTAPGTNCGFGTADSVKIQIKNFGSDTLTTIPVAYNVNGTGAITEVITTILLPGGTMDYTFTSATVNLSATGTYNFKLYTSVLTDGNSTNDTTSVTVENTLQSAPYSENFDSFTSGIGFNNAGSVLGLGWIATPDIPNFAWGVRAGVTGSGGTGPDDDRTIGGNYVYVEGSNGATGDVAELTSPCIDLSTIGSPRLSFWYHKFGGNMQDLYVDIYDGTTWFNGVDTIFGQVQTANADTFLLRDTTALTAFAGGTIQVRF
ncbi:MAG: hypothetical protein JKY48_02580 [Flavobacteriales bacterium]|nr:hypothetical protein [Flavobacteriales bacterium]